MKNYNTPRTLSECSFTVGYPTMPRTPAKRSVWPAVLYVLTLSATITAVLAWGLPA